MSARYFQGISVTGPVKASDARTFKEVVDALRICPILPLTQAEFLALDEKRRNEAKQVPFFVPACFRTSPSKRTTDLATHCNLIFLDIDPEKESVGGKWVETGKYPAAPFVRDPQILHTALQGFNFAAHVTASSTPEKPRMRIVVDASKIPLERYPAAAITIATMLGLPSVTKESKVSVQPMFLPVIFRDTPDDYQPLLAHCTDGRAFTVADIGESTHGSNGKTPHSHNGSNGSTPDTAPDALDFLKAPIPEISLAIAKEAIASIDADCSRQEWLNCAAALHHQFSPHKAEEAFEIFDEWSKTGSKYGGEDETRALWKSLRYSPIGRLPITIRTLLHKAREAGWDDKRVKENCFAATLRWLDDSKDISDLMDLGIRRIITTPLISTMQEDVLVSHLCSNAKRRFSYTVSPTSVRKDIKRLKEEIKAQEEPQEKAKEPPWAMDVCFIVGADEFYRHRTGEKIKTQAFNAAYGRFLLPTKKQLLAAGTPITPASESTPMARPSEYALHHLKIPTVQDYAYDPAQPNDRFFVYNGSRLVNTYSPTYPSPEPQLAKQAGVILQKHLGHLIAEPENRRHLLDFMAFHVQFPGRKIRWTVLIQSVEGAGKTFLAEVMKAVLGTEHVRTINGASIKNGWNEWAFGSQLVVIEEIKVSGVNKYEVMNLLKEPITNHQIPINEKFRNTRQVRNITNYMMFSNHHDALALTPGDRRYFVIKSPLQTKAQVLALGEEYFAELFNFLRDHPGAMRSFLDDWEISPDFRPDGHAPRTKYVQDMVNDSADDLTATVRRLLLEGDYPLVQYDIVSALKIKEVLSIEEGLTRVTAQQVAQVLREEGLQQVGRHLIGEERQYLWARPGIDEQHACEMALRRHKNNLKNLGMDLLFL